jgi:hypothetical protein
MKNPKIFKLLALVFFVTTLALGAFAFKDSIFKKFHKNPIKEALVANPYPIDTYASVPLHSRGWMLYAMDIVRNKKPTPPESARFYAYVSEAYSSSLNNFESIDPNIYVVRVINAIYPDLKDTTLAVLQKFGVDRATLDASYNSISQLYLLGRIGSDGFDADFDPSTQPVGSGFWKSDSDKPPFAPKAGTWARWVVQPHMWQSIVPEPIAYDSPEYKKQLEVVRTASSHRSALDSADINFWGGIPGTEAPAGIWQNRFFYETEEYGLSDKEYSYVQATLAKAIADSFMETWDVKYNYWTIRPSMVDPSIKTAMPNPNFPSYVSGHSTISRTAAEVLGVFFPDKKGKFLSDAEHARDSRLNAGIHFPMDNDEALKEIAKRSRFTPRTANYFLKRARDFAQVNKKDLTGGTVKDALNMLSVDEIGLNVSDKKFLEILIKKFNGGPIGLKTIAAGLSEEEATIEEVIEPYLLQLGLIERTARGRVATKKAYEHLNLKLQPEDKQDKLI